MISEEEARDRAQWIIEARLITRKSSRTEDIACYNWHSDYEVQPLKVVKGTGIAKSLFLNSSQGHGKNNVYATLPIPTGTGIEHHAQLGKPYLFFAQACPVDEETLLRIFRLEELPGHAYKHDFPEAVVIKKRYRKNPLLKGSKPKKAQELSEITKPSGNNAHGKTFRSRRPPH